MSSASLLWGVLFGAIGSGYFVYGKRQQHVVALLCGLALIVVPYFVTNSWLIVAVGAALAATPFVLRP